MYDKDGNDLGWQTNENWWYDTTNPRAFKYAKLDEDYPELYFPRAEMPPHVIKAYCDTVEKIYKDYVGKALDTIVEFGSGGGWFLKEFQDRGRYVHGYEGSTAGLNACVNRGIPEYMIHKRDFRTIINPTFERSEIALCSEVAEHICPPFAGTLVQNLVNHSDMILFSSEPPGTNQAHYHHVNEQPQQYWDELFAFFGYRCWMLSDDIYNACAQRARCIYAKSTKPQFE